METREGTEDGGPPKETGESRLALNPASSAQAMLTEAAREEGGGGKMCAITSRLAQQKQQW